jgi:hypothetical protein
LVNTLTTLADFITQFVRIRCQYTMAKSFWENTRYYGSDITLVDYLNYIS